jgi:hypothetical protein
MKIFGQSLPPPVKTSFWEQISSKKVNGRTRQELSHLSDESDWIVSTLTTVVYEPMYLNMDVFGNSPDHIPVFAKFERNMLEKR